MNTLRQTPLRRHSRAGGNPLVELGLFELFLRFLRRKVDSRLRGNNGSPTEIYVSTRSLPPLPSGGIGLGRGWLYGLHQFDFA